MRKHAKSLVRIIQKHVGKPRMGAEIGVWRGHTSEALLQTFPDLTLVMVDPWVQNTDDSITTQGSVGITDAREEAMSRTEFAAERRIIMEMTSVQAAGRWNREQQLDLVFIDGCHKYKYIKDDIEHWRPLVRQGGLLCGHDYQDNKREDWGVQQAVDELAVELGQKVQVMPGTVWWFILEK